jgi:hypothetical protein
MNHEALMVLKVTIGVLFIGMSAVTTVAGYDCNEGWIPRLSNEVSDWLTLTGPSVAYEGQSFTITGYCGAGDTCVIYDIYRTGDTAHPPYCEDHLDLVKEWFIDEDGSYSATVTLHGTWLHRLYLYNYRTATVTGLQEIRVVTPVETLAVTGPSTAVLVGQPITVTGSYTYGFVQHADKMIALWQQSDNSLLGGAVTDVTGNFTVTIPERSTAGDLTFYARSEDGIDSSPVTVHVVTAFPSIDPFVTDTPHTVAVGQPVTLSASVSNPGGVLLKTAQWTVVPPAGVATPTVIVNPDNTATFTPTAPGVYTASVTIEWTDDATSPTLGTLHAVTFGGTSGGTQVIVPTTIQSLTATPSYATVNHPITVAVTLSNTPSEVNPYTWTIAPPAGVATPTVTVNPDNTATFTPTAPGVYTASVTIEWASGEVTGTLEGTLPIQVSNEQTVTAGTVIALDGAQVGDPGGTLYQYAWLVVSAPAGSTPVFSAPDSARTSLTPDEAGLYVVGVSVTDTTGKLVATPQWSIVVTPTQASIVTDAQKVIERSGGTTAVQKAFSSSNNYKAFTNKLNALVQTIKAGNFADAQDKIQNDLLKRVVQWVTKDPDVKAKLEAQLQYIYNELGQLQAKQ